VANPEVGISVAVGPIAIEVQLSGFSDKVGDQVRRRLRCYGANCAPDVQLQLRSHGFHPFHYRSDTLAAPDGLSAVRHDFQIAKHSAAWVGAALASAVSVEVALRWVVAIELLKFDGLLLHASSAVLENEGHLFLGCSGRGKTTMVDSGQFESVLSDEITIISRNRAGEFRVWPSPFWGLERVGQGGDDCAIAGIHLLDGRERTNAAPISQSDLLAGIYERVVDLEAGRSLPARVLGTAASLASEVPGDRLSWRMGEPVGGALLGQQGQSSGGALQTNRGISC